MKKLFTKIKNPKVLRILITIVTIIVSISIFLFLEAKQGRVFIDDSLIEAPISSLTPTAPGTLTELDIYENEMVKKGDQIAIVNGAPVYTNTDGLIIMANDQLGSLVGPTTPVAQLISPTDMRIAGTLDENKGLSDIRVGQVVSFTVDALAGQTFWGYVDEISPSAKVTQAAFSISTERPTQQFVVFARFDSAKYPAIKNGMSAKMVVFTNTK